MRLHIWDHTHNQLGLRTLMETRMLDLFPNAGDQNELSALHALPFKQPDQKHPFTGVSDNFHDVERLRRKLLNTILTLSPMGSLQHDLGLPVTTARYVFGLMLHAEGDDDIQNYQVIVVREELLRHVNPGREYPGETGSVEDWQQQRWEYLQQLHELYFEKPEYPNVPVRDKQRLLITDPRMPLEMSFPGHRGDGHDDSIPPWDAVAASRQPSSLPYRLQSPMPLRSPSLRLLSP